MSHESHKQHSQRQDSLDDQLRDLIPVANRLGMYDAADFIQRKIRVTDSVCTCDAFKVPHTHARRSV